MSAGASTQLGRMMALVPYLQERAGISLEAVAADFGTTPQQILRDLKVLWFCGLPHAVTGEMIDIDMDAAEGDGIVTLTNAEYLSRPMRLTPVEATALVVALRSLREIAPSDLRPSVDSALQKIEEAHRSTTSVHVAPPAETPARAAVDAALRDGRQLELRYLVTSRDEITTRVVDPVRLITADGHTYLEAWCHTVGGLRTFRLDKIEHVGETGLPAGRHQPPERHGSQVFQADTGAPEAVVRLDAQHRWVPEYFPVDDVETHDDGSATIRLRYSDPEWLVRLMLRLGGGARVVEPADVDAEVRRRAEAALAAYSG